MASAPATAPRNHRGFPIQRRTIDVARHARALPGRPLQLRGSPGGNPLARWLAGVLLASPGAGARAAGRRVPGTVRRARRQCHRPHDRDGAVRPPPGGGALPVYRGARRRRLAAWQRDTGRQLAAGDHRRRSHRGLGACRAAQPLLPARCTDRRRPRAGWLAP